MMLDPHSLYELAAEPPDLHRPALVQALTGFVDAGSASRIARDHLMSHAEGHLVATFDVDQLLDYRTRRPSMVFQSDHWERAELPRLMLSAHADVDGTPFLVLSGPEPDLQWERFINAVIALIERLDVRMTIGINSIPMAVPHTRPTGVTAHATSRHLIEGYEPLSQRMQVPGSVGNLLEYRLGQLGRDALGFAVHVPHYLAQTEYPAAAERLVQSTAASAGLNLPVDDLQTAAQMVSSEIDRQIAEAEEAVALVRTLEEQYDARHRRHQDPVRTVTESGPLPTADELGAELERYLADQQRPDGSAAG